MKNHPCHDPTCEIDQRAPSPYAPAAEQETETILREHDGKPLYTIDNMLQAWHEGRRNLKHWGEGNSDKPDFATWIKTVPVRAPSPAQEKPSKYAVEPPEWFAKAAQEKPVEAEWTRETVKQIETDAINSETNRRDVIAKAHNAALASSPSEDTKRLELAMVALRKIDAEAPVTRAASARCTDPDCWPCKMWQIAHDTIAAMSSQPQQIPLSAPTQDSASPPTQVAQGRQSQETGGGQSQ